MAYDSTYKGDSPGKKLMRYRAWVGMQEIAHSFNIPFEGALVLAGEGGDLGVMRGLGYDMTKVSAIDRDPFLVEWCNHHFPRVCNINGELSDVVRDGLEPYNMAHIDFCGGISVDNIHTMASVLAGTSTHPSVFAVTMLKGREGERSEGLMEGIPRLHRRRLYKAARKHGNAFAEHVFSNRKLDGNLLCEIEKERLQRSASKNGAPQWNRVIKRTGKLGQMGTAIVRANVMQKCVEYLWDAYDLHHKLGLEDDFLCMQQVGVMAYHSGTEKGGGTPFVTVLYLVFRTSQWDAVSNRLHILCDPKCPRLPYRALTLQECVDSLNPTIAYLTKFHPHSVVADLFGIKQSSIPAILAHATRGTYKAKPIVQFGMNPRPEYDIPTTTILCKTQGGEP